MQSGNGRLLFLLVFGFLSVALLWGASPIPAHAQGDALNELSEEEQRQVRIAERFLTVLERNPRRGTALDRIYGHHVEFGTLDKFLQSLHSRVKKDPTDGVGWMLLGLFEAHRGEDAEAIDAFKKAETLRADDALASYYLGQSLLLLGQPEQAVAALERAIDRKPRRTDLLEIFQQLGRVHQRAQRTEEALEVWKRLEALFPNDPRVQEQIAVTLVEEGEYALALPRYEKLAQLVRDDYRRTMFRIEAAELKIRENRRDEGISDFEKLLGDLNPQGWLHRDVRRRIEEVFLRSGNQDGLVAYYEKWIESHREDVDAMARLAKFLASSARVPEATKWMERALKLAPSRTELRKAFIDQLVDDQRYTEAIKQYEKLVEAAPGNPDFLRDWGKLVLKNKELTPEARRAEATRIWNKILAARPDDAVTTAQTADLFRQSKMNEPALALYKKAVEQAPGEPQYREYLGEFYHILKRPDDALATWKAIAEGERRTAVNVARLAEIYNSFGYLQEAVEQIGQACQLDPKDFALQLKAAEYHSRAGKYDPALSFLEAAEKLAVNYEEQDAVVKQRIEVFRSSRRLDDIIAELSSKVHGDKDGPTPSGADQWRLLARYCEADSRWVDATKAIETALKKDPKSIPSLTTAARIAELSGDYGRAAQMNRRLAATDRRLRGDHLMNVARLEAQMGRAEQALQAGRDLIVSAPGNTDHYEFYASLCFRLGKAEEGVDTLRKAVRINPTEPHLIMALGSALSNELRTDEAIEVYWRAFEKTDDLDDKTSLMMKLTNLYEQIGQVDKLLERLERDRREEDKRREMTICLAQAHHTSGDYGAARRELESLLSEDTRDTNLLQQLSKLCEQASDLDGAIQYQQQLAEIAPGHETEYRLATLLQSRGDRDQASEILLKLMRREENPVRRLRNIDSLFTQAAYENVISLTEPLLSEQRDDWELLYREGVAWASLDKTEEAKDRFERLLSLPAAHEELGVAAAEKFKRDQAKAKSDNLRGIQSTMPTRRSPLTMLSMSSQIRMAAGLDPDRSYYGSRARPVWTPGAFGEARMAAYAWLMRLDEDQETKQDDDTSQQTGLQKRLAQLAAAAAQKDAPRRVIYDWMYVEQLRGNLDSIFRVARRLAREGGREEKQFFLTSLTMRGVDAASQQAVRSRNELPKRKPLSEEDLELMLQCHEALASESNREVDAAMFGGRVAYGANGQVYVQIAGRYVLVSGLVQGGVHIGTVIEELKLAGRTEQAEQLIQKQIDSAKSSSHLVGAMNLLLGEEQFEKVQACFPRWVKAAHQTIAKGPIASLSTSRRSRSASNVADPLTPAGNLLINWMGHLGPEKEHEQILSILDAALDISTDVARKKRVEQSRRRGRRRSASFSTPSNTYFSLKYGKETIRARLDYPRPNEHVDTATIMLLRQVYEVFQRNDVVGDLPEHLEKRLRVASPGEKLYATLWLAYVRWWLEEKEEALALLKQAGASLNDPAFRIEIAMLYQTVGDLEQSLEIMEAITPRDRRLVQQREMMAMQLAQRLGDIDRARQAAERLFGLRLDTNTQLALVNQMRSLGMHKMAEAVTSRLQRRSGGSLSSMASLMTLYQGQGKTNLAQQLAHTILRRSKPPLSGMASAGRNPFRYSTRTSDSQMRAQALRLLQQTGALKDLIARLETQIEKSPKSSRLYEELIEHYQASNQRDKVGQMLAKAVSARPDAAALRYQLAKHLEASGKQAEACDQYLAILKQKPQWVAEDLSSIRRTFERANRALDLIKAFDNINLKLMRQPYYIIDLVSNLLRGRGSENSEENLDLALNLFEKVFEAFPQYRNNMLSRMYRNELWKNDRVFELGKKAVIPTDSEVAAAPWFGLNNIYSYSSGGRVNAHFHRMLDGIRGSGKMPQLKQAIQQRLQQAPAWRGGEAMLALIDLKQNRKKQAKARLEKLVADDQTLKDMPPDSCWIIGQELDQYEDTRAVALRLFETAMNKPNTMTQIQYSPAARLVKLYNDIGRQQDARNLLVQQVKKKTYDGYDAQYSSYLHIENSVWAGQQFLKMDFPVDAVRIFRELSANPTLIEQAGQWYGSRPDYFKTQVDKGLKDSLAALDSTNAEEAMTQLLADPHFGPKQLPPHATVLDLMLMSPHIVDLRKKSMESPLVDLLITISKDDAVAVGIRKRLADLRAKYPADLSIGITESAYLLRSKHEQAKSALKRLLAVVSDRPLEAVKPGRRPNSRQRREALPQVSLWLVARECLETDEHQETGAVLAQRAVEAARRQTGDGHAAAILYDWGKTALARGDRQQAEAKWSELLDIVTKRPVRKKSPPKNQSGHLYNGGDRTLKPQFIHGAGGRFSFVSFQRGGADKPKRIPPLTLSQFRLTMEIALAAAENGMPALSRKAVKASMVGGTPVADIAVSTNLRSGRFGASPFGGSSTTGSGLSNIETEVAQSLRKVIARWQGSNNNRAYPPQEVYQLLVPIVFPDNRPAEILMFADSAKLQQAQANSLGAVLVRWARRAKQLDDLSARIEQRKQHPQSQIPALVMQTKIALAGGKLDEAKTVLSELAQRVEKGVLAPMTKLACHAALPASERKELEEPAYAILQVAVNLQIQTAAANRNSSATDLTLGKLVSKVNRYLCKEPEEVKKFFENYLVGRQSYYSRYSGTYGQYLQWRDMALIAEEAAKAGVPTVALDYMGRVADFSYENYSRPSTTTAMAVACREMSLLPAEKQYRAWRDWTLPQEGRQTVRLVAEWVEPVRAPQSFLKTVEAGGQLHTGDMLSNFTELIASAEKTGRLEELRDLTKKAYDQKLENAAFLHALVLIQLGDAETGAPVIEPIINTVVDRLKRKSGQPTPDGWGDYLVYRACMQSPEFVRLYQTKRGRLQRGLRAVGRSPTLARLNVDYALRAGQNRNRTMRPGDDPQLAHWFPATTREKAPSGVDPWWVAQEGHLAHLTGAGSDLMYFAYPVTGDFEFSIDAYKGSWAETDAGYNGVVVESQKYGSRTTLWSTGGHESINLPKALLRDNESFGVITIKVADGKMQYLLNHHVVYEEKVSGASPWITLYTDYGRPTTFRNPRFSGNPTIPRQVVLVSGDHMDGWNTSFFGESQPRRRLMAQQAKSENDSLARQQRQEPTQFHWHAKEGILNSRAPGNQTNSPGWAYYHRPLRDGESFAYEFFYVPGESIAHPTIGRIALLLDPEGIVEHWISRPDWDEPVLGITDDNRITHSKARRGDGELPLKSGQWNQVNVTLAGAVIEVKLNDQLIYQRPLEAEIDHRFGLFRGKGQSLKVRQPKLSGPWPKSLTSRIRNNLLVSSKRYTGVDRRLLNQILGEKFFRRDAAAVVAQARKLPLERAYQKLLAYVLPTPSHSRCRLYFELVTSKNPGHQEIVCPAMELIAIAERAGKLDELSTAIHTMRLQGPIVKRGKLAVEALVAMHTGQFETARKRMADLHQYVAAGLNKQMSIGDRAMEFVVAWQAAKHPQLQFAAWDIASELLAKQRDNKFKPNDASWETSVGILVGHVENAIATSKPSLLQGAPKTALTQWTNVPYYKPQLRGRGYRHTQWRYQRGALQHIPGGTWGQLFFQSPLRGKFEIVAQRALHGWREMAIAYGMHSAEPRYDYKAKRVVKVMHSSKDTVDEIKMPGRGGWVADFRIAARDNQITTFVNGMKLHQQTLTPQPDPWIVLQATSPGNASTVRNLRIIGDPEIPDEINLIDIAGWAGWRADIYGEYFSLDENNTRAPWKKVGDEIHGQLREDFSVAHLQSLLMYQRPMLEDGVIEFESYYIPGEFEAHPAVGRTALLASAKGVQKHTLTDAQYDEADLPPANAAPIDGAADAVPLKAKQWNRYKLTLAGDQLTLTINDHDVATIALTEPPSERHFGLFRYANKTKCRVRNLVYRGQWPKTLPPVEKQQLARPADGGQFENTSPPTVFAFTDTAEKLKAAGLNWGGPADKITNVDRGTRMLLSEADGYSGWPRFHLRKPIEGDCVVTLDFENLKMTPPKTGWGSTFGLRAIVDEGDGVWVEVGLGKNVKGQQHLKTARRHKTLAGKDKHDGRYLLSKITAGRLRFVRSGGLISTYYAEKGASEFQLLETWPVGKSPIKEITLQSGGSDAATVIDVVVTQLTIER